MQTWLKTVLSRGPAEILVALDYLLLMRKINANVNESQLLGILRWVKPSAWLHLLHHSVLLANERRVCLEHYFLLRVNVLLLSCIQNVFLLQALQCVCLLVFNILDLKEKIGVKSLIKISYRNLKLKQDLDVFVSSRDGHDSNPYLLKLYMRANKNFVKVINCVNKLLFPRYLFPLREKKRGPGDNQVQRIKGVSRYQFHASKSPHSKGSDNFQFIEC